MASNISAKKQKSQLLVHGDNVILLAIIGSVLIRWSVSLGNYSGWF